MYISCKFKCQLSFNWHLNLTKVCATQFRTLRSLQQHCSPSYRLYILLIAGKYLHSGIIIIKEEDWVHKTSWSSSLCIEVSVPFQKSEQSCIYVLELSIVSLFLRFLIILITVMTVWVLCVFSFYLYRKIENKFIIFFLSWVLICFHSNFTMICWYFYFCRYYTY